LFNFYFEIMVAKSKKNGFPFLFFSIFYFPMFRRLFYFLMFRRFPYSMDSSLGSSLD